MRHDQPPRAARPTTALVSGSRQSGATGVVALLMAAGAGSRFGGPKALARSVDGTPWLRQRVTTLRLGGCDQVVVVLGAQAEAARKLVPQGAEVVVAQRWQEGMSASLEIGLAAVAALPGPPTAALVALVDTPGLTTAAVARLLATAGQGVEVLARAVYHGVPGHPVLIGRGHWSAIARTGGGDRGAGAYLRAAGAREVECSDIADGSDVDVPPGPGPASPRGPG